MSEKLKSPLRIIIQPATSPEGWWEYAILEGLGDNSPSDVQGPFHTRTGALIHALKTVEFWESEERRLGERT